MHGCIDEAMASAGVFVCVAAAAFVYVAGAGELAAFSATSEPGGLEQTEPSFIQLCTFLIVSVCLEASMYV